MPLVHNKYSSRKPTTTINPKICLEKQKIKEKSEKHETILASLVDLHQNTVTRQIDTSLTTRDSIPVYSSLSPNYLTFTRETNNTSNKSFLIYALDVVRTLAAAGLERKIINYIDSESLMSSRNLSLVGLSLLLLFLNSLIYVFSNIYVNKNNDNDNDSESKSSGKVNVPESLIVKDFDISDVIRKISEKNERE